MTSQEIEALRAQRHRTSDSDGIQILFLETVAGRGNAGDVVVVSASAARDLISRGVAEAVSVTYP